jgi:hypothetical protein
MTVDLKRVLMELGNRLVTEHHFDPATVPFSRENSTYRIKQFTDWVNSTPETRAVLQELGFEWSMSGFCRRVPAAEQITAQGCLEDVQGAIELATQYPSADPETREVIRRTLSLTPGIQDCLRELLDAEREAIAQIADDMDYSPDGALARQIRARKGTP